MSLGPAFGRCNRSRNGQLSRCMGTSFSVTAILSNTQCQLISLSLSLFHASLLFCVKWCASPGLHGSYAPDCFTPYQRHWLYNGAPLVAFYDTLGIRRTYSRLKLPASSRGTINERVWVSGHFLDLKPPASSRADAVRNLIPCILCIEMNWTKLHFIAQILSFICEHSWV